MARTPDSKSVSEFNSRRLCYTVVLLALMRYVPRMGNIAIIIRAVGVHHNALAYDQEQLAARFVDEMKAAGHSVLSAHVEGAGSQDVSKGTAACREAGVIREIKDVDYFGRSAYERYCGASAGKSLISGAELPPFDSLKDEIKAAWRASADPSAPRYVRAAEPKGA